MNANDSDWNTSNFSFSSAISNLDSTVIESIESVHAEEEDHLSVLRERALQSMTQSVNNDACANFTSLVNINLDQQCEFDPANGAQETFPPQSQNESPAMPIATMTEEQTPIEENVSRFLTAARRDKGERRENEANSPKLNAEERKQLVIEILTLCPDESEIWEVTKMVQDFHKKVLQGSIRSPTATGEALIHPCSCRTNLRCGPRYGSNSGRMEAVKDKVNS